jgi:dihydrofolate synthase/folylpolyglutamate synthase
VQIGGKPLDDATFLSYLNEFLALIARWPDIRPTYFELLTAFAYWVFKQESVDYMVIEVGLGGLLDATNVIDTEKVCVITPIGLDHTEILGDTITKIAVQKAGIINDGSTVFVAQQEEDVERVIQETCERHEAPMQVIAPNIETLVITPLFQQENFGLAREVARYIAGRDGLPLVDEDTVASCMTNTPPGRFETYQVGEKTVILDGAHNPQKLNAFVRSLRLNHSESIDWLVGFVSAPEQKIATCLRELASENDDYIFTDFTVGQDIKGRKSVPATDVARVMEQVAGKICDVVPDPYDALNKLLATKKRTVVVTGSLYLVAKLRQSVIDQAT